MFIIIWLLFGLLCAIIASSKNKNVGMAILGGILFGPFALLYYIFASSEKTSREEEEKEVCSNCESQVSISDKFCPECGLKVKEEQDKIICPKCHFKNREDIKFCTKCGHKLLIEELELEEEIQFICEDCDKEFKNDDELNKHLKICKKRQIRIQRDKNLFFWIIAIVIILGIGYYFLINKEFLFLSGLIIITFLITPIFDLSFNKCIKYVPKINKFELNRKKKVIMLIIISLLFLLISFMIPKCPDSCNDENHCTNDYCSASTKYKCVNQPIVPCDGNKICELGEFDISSDCPICDDKNKCTTNEYNYDKKECKYIPISGCK